MPRVIFREASLERLSSPEQLDQLMRATSPKGWLALAALSSLLVAAVLWGIWGTIPTKVVGSTILLKTGGVKNVVTPFAGQVATLPVGAGALVGAGQVVATVGQPGQDEVFEVTSPYTGRVLEVKVDQGNLVSAGASLLSLELVGDDVKLEAVMYVSPTDGKNVQPGLDVQISPSTVRPEEYGFLLGTVKAVGEFPSTFEGILRTLGSEELAQALAVGAAPIEIQIELLPDPTTPSGYRWSSRAGPPAEIQSGTLGTATIIVGQQRPISLVLPIK
ncbi:MAG: NHLP bacteriocin system secretion protein [Chloroflexota bacterium]